VIGLTTSESFTDTNVNQGATYTYVVRAVDTSLNRSAYSDLVSATAALRTVSVTFNVTIPSGSPTGATVYIAGTLDRLDGGLPQWNPGGVSLSQVSATLWTITLTGKEGTQLSYKYTLGTWELVEKDGACGEIPDRTLTLVYGSNGSQVVSDTVVNWRNVTPCGN
jgi:hypothetical protein